MPYKKDFFVTQEPRDNIGYDSSYTKYYDLTYQNYNKCIYY